MRSAGASGEQTIEGTDLLVAAGRTPNTEDIGADLPRSPWPSIIRGNFSACAEYGGLVYPARAAAHPMRRGSLLRGEESRS